MSSPLRPFDRTFYRDYKNDLGLHYPEICEEAFPRSGNHRHVAEVIWGFAVEPVEVDEEDVVEIRRGREIIRRGYDEEGLDEL